MLHYITGNTDGHPGNVLTRSTGPLAEDIRPGIIDGGFAFPSGSSDSISSVFLPQVFGQPLDSSIVTTANLADGPALTLRLDGVGLSPAQIQGVMGRLAEVQSGVITGSAYPDALVGGEWNIIKPAIGGPS